MSYKTIMVYLAVGAENRAKIAVAKHLADRFEARLIGIAASELSPPLYFADGEAAQKVLSEGEDAIKTALTQLEAEFDRDADRASSSCEWRCARQMPAQYIANEARAADLIVTGRSNSIVLSDAFTSADPSDLVMQVGRPLLIVPESGAWLDARSSIVAWKDTAEARRAIVDALPLLRMSKDVAVAGIIEGKSLSKEESERQIQDVIGWLGCHGVIASPIVVDAQGQAGEQLERIASEVGAGLIVAGAYGHSRLREWVFGGVTRHLMQASERCVLLSR
jgi:nucleotide-binding universal stress UspA family protein